MSRIVRGPSTDVVPMRAVVGHSRQGAPHLPSSFKAMVTEGFISEEELSDKLAEAQRNGARDAERRLMGQLNSALQNLETILDELSHFRRDLFKESQADVLDLISAVSKKIIAKELSLNSDLLKSIVEKALLILEKEKRVNLVLSPLDLDIFERAKPGLLEKYKGLEDLGIQVDSRLPAGRVLAKTQRMEVDISPEAMTDQLLSQIKKSTEPVTSTNNPEDVV